MKVSLKQAFYFMRVLSFAYLISVVSSNGQFYVGFLGFANLENLNYKGQCCDGVRTEAGCTDFCDLIFEVSIEGIDSHPATGKRPSEQPIDNDNAILFPSSYEGVINPMTFDFRKWSGYVNVTVNVYDEDNEGELDLVDEFLFSFIHDGPSLDFIYMKGIGQRPFNPSELRMVFRYDCDPTYYGQNCSIDCLVHPNNQECPDTANRPNSMNGVTDWLSLLTTTPRGTTEKRCGFTRKTQDTVTEKETLNKTEWCGNGSMSISNGTTLPHTGKTTPQPATMDNPVILDPTTNQNNPLSSISNIMSDRMDVTSPMSSSTSKPTSTTTETKSAFVTMVSDVYTKPQKSSKVTELKTSNTQGTTTNPQSFSTNEVSKSTKSEDKTRTTDSILFFTKISTKSVVNTMQVHVTNTGSRTTEHVDTSKESTSSDFINNNGQGSSDTRHVTFSPSKVSGSLMRHSHPVTSEMTTESKPDPSSSDNDPMEYWPAIVGGVLGALVLVAIIAFVLYYRKQKAIRKRQDIYNVNPKRWALQPPRENGTTAKSEVALETEQV